MAEFVITRDEEYLEHHGIEGQKWGVRRFQNKDGTRTAAGKKREAAARETDSMSDDELRNKINRMQNEQNYRRIMANRNQSKVPSRLKAASDIMQIAGSTLEIGNAIANAGRPSNQEIDQNMRLSKEQKEAMKEQNKVYKEQMGAVKGVVNDTRRITDGTRNLSDRFSKSKDDPKVTSDLDKMSDAELKKQINRLLLEEQYDRLAAPKNVSRGEKFVNNVLPVIATTVGIAGGIASLILNIQTLRGK